MVLIRIIVTPLTLDVDAFENSRADELTDDDVKCVPSIRVRTRSVPLIVVPHKWYSLRCPFLVTKDTRTLG
jgi:hypothetical protein